MARRRHYRGLVRFPGLGFLPKVPSSVRPVDVAVGAGLGIAGTLALTKAATMTSAIPSIVTDNIGIAGGVVTAGALYFAQKRKNPARAAGHAIGALLGAAVVWATPKVVAAAGMAGLINMPQGMGGPIFANPRTHASGAGLSGFRGPIFANPNTNANLGRLARMQGVGDENEDGMFPAP